MLGCSEIDTEVSDADIETTESNDCREISRDNKDINEVLVMMQERTRFFYKDK